MRTNQRNGTLAQLRYAKVEDGFDGICNKAVHLFTEHKAIQTELYNINFVFSDGDAKLTQWRFLYSRLPYVLAYAWRLVEHIGEALCPTHPEYGPDVSRRVAAFVALSARNCAHVTLPLKQFHTAQKDWLLKHCAASGYRRPLKRDLERMALSGAFPGEDEASVDARLARFSAQALLTRAHAKAEDPD